MYHKCKKYDNRINIQRKLCQECAVKYQQCTNCLDTIKGLLGYICKTCEYAGVKSW